MADGLEPFSAGEVSILSELDVMGGHLDDPLIRWRVVFYKVRDQGPFLIEGPADTLPQDEIRRRIRNQVDQLNALLPPRELR